ncbi:MAG: hypothetical protein EOO24_17015, partial [Comamonadaceae bacterium]
MHQPRADARAHRAHGAVPRVRRQRHVHGAGLHRRRRLGVSAQLLVNARARLGECPLWCERSGALYWTDIESATVSRWRERDGQLRHWTLPERVGCFALCERPSTLLLGLASGIALFDLDSETLSPIRPVEPENPDTRI